jgi:hypothetical protein
MDDLIGYEGFYKINRQGEIWSCSRRMMMKPQLEKGYYWVGLIDKNKKRYKGRIHRLLAFQYLPNPDDKTEVDHIDRNRANNDLSNLRWVSHKENANNIEEGNGCVYLDKSTTARLGHDYYKACYSITVEGVRQTKTASHRDKTLLEEWVRTKGGVEIPKRIQKGELRDCEGSVRPRTDYEGFIAVYRLKQKSSKDRAVCEAWLEEQRNPTV